MHFNVEAQIASFKQMCSLHFFVILVYFLII